jgi:Putative peptidoglycan binding domain
MTTHAFRRLPVSSLSGRALAAAAFVGLLAQATTAAAQTPAADFDGTNATFFISAKSILRYGDSLLSKQYLTVGTEGMQLKGRGRCTVFVCPVSFNGIDLFARRSRLSMDAPGGGGQPGYGGQQPGNRPPVQPGGTGYGGGTPGKGCAGITRTLRRGDESGEVRILQEILIKAGYQEITPDGKYGRKTEAAVTQFQRKTNIKADGTVGPKTLSFLPC